jgi:hypothetical protein
LYRHYIELQLKNLISSGKSLLDETPEYPRSHDLSKLWAECRPILTRIFGESPTKDLDTVESLINELHSIDPASISFRYPVDRKDDTTIPSSLTSLNLRQCRGIMDKLASFLDGADTGIWVYLDTKHEMEEYLPGS